MALLVEHLEEIVRRALPLPRTIPRLQARLEQVRAELAVAHANWIRGFEDENVVQRLFNEETTIQRDLEQEKQQAEYDRRGYARN